MESPSASLVVRFSHAMPWRPLELAPLRTQKSKCLAAGLLVPASNLLIVEEAALAGGEVVVASDGLAAAPAEVDLAVPGLRFSHASTHPLINTPKPFKPIVWDGGFRKLRWLKRQFG